MSPRAAGAVSAAARPAVSLPPAGAPAPEFSLSDQHGARQTLSGLVHRQRAALLVYYPFAFSSVCGGELRALRDAMAEFRRHSVQPVAISCDPLYALRVYADRDGFEFPLLSDFWPHGAAAQSYGVFDEVRGCASRASFLVDAGGLIRWSVLNPIHQERPLSAYLDALDLLDP